MNNGINVNSEIGKLKSVLLHRQRWEGREYYPRHNETTFI
ncbi:hypothetical protein ICE98_03716 [Lactococcus lactis]|nr:hypothetical protein [Lactococcus lactis]